jgi:O-antigen/teichoic acid export membrane protein
LNFINKIRSSELFKITSLNSVSVLIKIGIGLITSKVFAVFAGPGGMAFIGNLRNFLTSAESIATLGFQNGIVKYVAENEENEAGLKKILSTLLVSLTTVSVIIGSVLFFFAEYWNRQIFNEEQDFSYVFRILAFILPFYIASLYLVSIINGFGKFRKVIYINSIGSILGLFVTLFFVWKYAVFGALLSVIITPSLHFFVSMYFLSKEIAVIKFFSFKAFDLGIFKNLSHYFLMAVVSGILGPIVYLLIRNHVIDTVGLKEAGFWEAMTRISTYYLLFINTLLTVYYYPQLVTANDDVETKSVFWNFYKNVLPFFGIALIILFAFRNIIIKVLFTSDFEPVSQLFLWQLTGDFFKTISWILGLQFFAKKMTKAFIITEIVSLSILLSSSMVLINTYKMEGIVMAHAFTYFIYCIVLGVYFRKKLI